MLINSYRFVGSVRSNVHSIFLRSYCRCHNMEIPCEYQQHAREAKNFIYENIIELFFKVRH